MICLHYRVAYCCDALEKVLGKGFVGAFEGLDKVYSFVGLLAARIDTLDAQGHGEKTV
jgi:hypothetical protein